MSDRISLPPTPPGLQDQMYRGDGGPQRMPTPPRSTLVVGGPAYFTPEGYEAPRQPVQSFMPTDTRPDPIGDQFRRVNPPPPAQTAPPPPPPPPPVPAPTPAPAPISDPEPIIDPVEEPVVEPDFPIYGGPAQPYIPGLTPFPGIPGLGDLDFSGLPGMGNIDIDAIIQEYQDRIDAGEPEPFDSFLPTQPDPRDIAYASVGGPGGPPRTAYTMPDYGSAGATPPENNFFVDGDGNLNVGDGIIRTMGPPMGPQDSNTAAPEPEFVPPPQEPNGFFPGINTEDFEDFDFGETTGNPYGAILNNPFSIPFKGEINEAALQAIQSPGSKDFRAPRTPQAQAPAPVYTPPPSQIPMQGMMDDYDFGNPNLRNMRGFDPRR